MKKILALSTTFIIACALCFEASASSSDTPQVKGTPQASTSGQDPQIQISRQDYQKLLDQAQRLERENEFLRSSIAAKLPTLRDAQYYLGEH